MWLIKHKIVFVGVIAIGDFEFNIWVYIEVINCTMMKYKA